VIGLAGLPLTALVFANLPDRGWSLAKPFSLLLFGWLIWFPLTLIPALPFNRAWIALTLALYLVGNLLLLLWVARVREALAGLFARQRGYIALSEALFAGSFAAMIWERSFTPTVVDTEKFMDVAFLSSIWRAPHLPPPDPWLSGQPINYYYFGHYLIALVAKALGTVPGTAFNLGVGLIFALAAVAIFGVAANLFATISPARRWPWSGLVGLTSVVCVLALGNLNSAQVWWQNALALARQLPALYSSPWAWWLHRDIWTQYDWWAPSRVIPNTINEFPAFSFALADLHAHVLALPFATVAVGLAFNLLLARRSGIHAFGDGRLSLLSLLASGVALGGLYAINGWDLPTYLGLALLALAIQQWLAHERRFTMALLTDFLTLALLLGGLCLVCYLPFYRDYSSPGEGVGLVPANARTPIGYEVAIFGLPLFVILSLAVLRLARRWPASATQVSLAVALVLALGSWLAPTLPIWTLLWAMLLIAVCAYLAAGLLGLRLGRTTPVDSLEGARLDDRTRASAWFWCLVGTAIALIAVCELVFLRDVFAFGDHGALGASFRMNTVFKLYYQAWLLLGIVTGPALFWLFGAAFRWMRTTIGAAFQAAPASASIDATSGALVLQRSSDLAAVRPIEPIAQLAAVVPSGDSTPAGTSAAVRASSRSRDRRTGPDTLRLFTAGGIVLWIVVCIALVGAATIYPVLATSVRTNNFTSARSLDGTAYMSADPANQGDAQAIAWLNAHVTGDPVIVEGAQYLEYTHYGRISAFTGLPTLMGWGGHEYQWRFNWLQQPGRGDVIGQRLNAVTQIYTDASAQQVLAQLRQYSARYVYVGAAERQLYPTANLERFATFLRVVYHTTDVTIYAVP
jgi:YYY domain-containing protein